MLKEDELPEELEHAINENSAYLTRAKKQRADLEKARGFFKKGVSKDKRSKGTGDLKKRLPCAKCGQLGHWHKDEACPDFNKPFKKGQRGKGQGKKSQRSYVTFMEPCHEVYAMTVNGQELPFVAYVDTACAKSVVGSSAASLLLEHCQEVQWPCEEVPDHEPFRFGPGKRIWSTKALVFAVTWGGHTVVLRVSVVDPDVPFLLSKGVFKRLGAQIDLEVNECVFRRLNRGVEMLHDLTSGHVGIELVKP